MPGVADTLDRVIDNLTSGTDFKLVNLLNMEIANRTPKNRNTSIDHPEY